MEKEKCQIKDIIVSSSFDKNLKYDYVNDKNYDNEIGTINNLVYHEYIENNRDITTNKISQHDMYCISNNIRNSREEFVVNNNINVNFKTYPKCNSMIGNIEEGSEVTFDISRPINNNEMGNITKLDYDNTNIFTSNDLIYHEYFKNNRDISTNKIFKHDMSEGITEA